MWKANGGRPAIVTADEIAPVLYEFGSDGARITDLMDKLGVKRAALVRSIELALVNDDPRITRRWVAGSWRYYHAELCTIEVNKAPAAFELKTRIATPQEALELFAHQQRQMAIRRGLSHELTVEQLAVLMTGNCYFCGMPPEERVISRGPRVVYVLRSHALDRLDSSRGYSVDNCVPCCATCNWMKHEDSVDEFRQRIERIYQNFAKAA
jgi:hypothetical protein